MGFDLGRLGKVKLEVSAAGVEEASLVELGESKIEGCVGKDAGRSEELEMNASKSLAVASAIRLPSMRKNPATVRVSATSMKRMPRGVRVTEGSLNKLWSGSSFHPNRSV